MVGPGGWPGPFSCMPLRTPPLVWGRQTPISQIGQLLSNICSKQFIKLTSGPAYKLSLISSIESPGTDSRVIRSTKPGLELAGSNESREPNIVAGRAILSCK